MAQTQLNHRALAISTTAVAWFLFWCLVMLSNFCFAERQLKDKQPEIFVEKVEIQGFLPRIVQFFWQAGKSSYEHVWPVSSSLCLQLSVTLWHIDNMKKRIWFFHDFSFFHLPFQYLHFGIYLLVEQEMEFSWKIVVGTIVGFFGAALGSVGGVGGGGIFVPMLTLIIGFDPKSSTAISKCQYCLLNLLHIF